MGRVYREPPITEALCEFRFANNELWDSTLPGLFYAEIRNQFPIKRDRTMVEMAVKVDHAQGDTDLQGRTVPRIQFLSQDETRVVQIGPGILSINVLKHYPKWPGFKASIFEILDKYNRVVPAQRLERIGLRYINQIKVDAKRAIHDWFTYYPALPARLQNAPSMLLLRTEHMMTEQNGRLIFTLASPQGSLAEERNYVLDLDFVTLTAPSNTQEMCERWVDVAHDEIEATFEATITDTLRLQFQEVVNNHV
jgi:uncharacterized protein (TIGR04255 family)